MTLLNVRLKITTTLATATLVAVSIIGCGKKAELKAPLPEVIKAPAETTTQAKPPVKDTLGIQGAYRGVQDLQERIRLATMPRERDSLRVLLARTLAGFREYRASGAAYDSVSTSGPWAEEALFEGGRAYLLDETYGPALRMLLAGRKAFPQKANERGLGLLVGYAYEGLMQYGKAQDEYQSLIAGGSALEGYARLRLGVVFRKMDKRADGTRVLEGLAAQGSGTPVALLAKAELVTGRRKKAIKMPALPATPDTSQEAKLRGGFAYARRLMKRGNYTAAIRSFSRVAKAGGSRGPEARYYIGRCYEFMGELAKALESYQQSQSEGPKSGIADDALWRAGLTHFKMGKCDEAIKDWERVLAEYPKSQFYEESAFWSGRCWEGKGENGKAIAAYRKVEEEDPFQYYAFKARERIAFLDTTVRDPLGSDTLTTREWLGAWSKDIALDSARWVGTLKRPYVQRGLALLRDGFLKEGAMELAPLEQEYRTTPYILWQLGKIYERDGADSRTIWCGRRILRLAPPAERPRVTQEVIAMMYPVCYARTLLEQGARWKVDPSFALGIIREESRFRAKDVSRTGARGLMQVMPKTGRKIARDLGVSGFQVSDLFDPYTSLAFGVYYLSAVRHDVGDQKELIAAGYNAGPLAVQEWTAAKSPKDIAAFIEDIPYLETREYVKTVLGSTWTYQQRLGRMGKGT
jgi:TolA-binding protein